MKFSIYVINFDCNLVLNLFCFNGSSIFEIVTVFRFWNVRLVGCVSCSARWVGFFFDFIFRFVFFQFLVSRFWFFLQGGLFKTFRCLRVISRINRQYSIGQLERFQYSFFGLRGVRELVRREDLVYSFRVGRERVTQFFWISYSERMIVFLLTVRIQWRCVVNKYFTGFRFVRGVG